MSFPQPNQHIRSALRWILVRPWRLWTAILGGAVSGLALPRYHLWGFSFVAVALILLSVRKLRFFKATAVGIAGGVAFYLSQTDWMSTYLGPVPWIALSVLEGLIFGLGMGAIAVVWNWLDQNLGGASRRAAIPLAITTLWVAREWIAQHQIYGGYPFSSVGQAHADTFFAKWAFYGGTPAVSFAVVALTALLLQALLEPHLAKAWISQSLAGLMILVPALTFIQVSKERGTVDLGVVQGNANAGLFANPEAGSILGKHLIASNQLKTDPRFEDLDVVVWPENASDINPLDYPVARKTIDFFVNDFIKKPLIFGAITFRGSEMFNSSLLWLPEAGFSDIYDKKRPVPFAEYVPDRQIWEPLAPDLIGLIWRDYSMGTRDGIFEVGDVKFGTLICFELAIPELSAELVRQGAQVILAQSNNADFGTSNETFQQAAISRLRAIETGRPVIYASTVGPSAVYLPDGRIAYRQQAFTAQAFIAKLPLSDKLTPAMQIGEGFNIAVGVAATGLLLLPLIGRFGRRRVKNSETPE